MGFPRLVFSRLSLSRDDEKTWSLASSIGYKAIVSMIKDQLEQEQREKALEKMPAWQRETAKLKRKPLTRSQLKELATCRKVVSVTVPGVGDKPSSAVRFLNTAYGNEDLNVEFDTSNLSNLHHVVDFLADQGFDESLRHRPRDPDLPKGVHRRCYKGLDRFLTRGISVSDQRPLLQSRRLSKIWTRPKRRAPMRMSPRPMTKMVLVTMSRWL